MPRSRQKLHIARNGFHKNIFKKLQLHTSAAQSKFSDLALLFALLITKVTIVSVILFGHF